MEIITNNGTNDVDTTDVLCEYLTKCNACGELCERCKHNKNLSSGGKSYFEEEEWRKEAGY